MFSNNVCRQVPLVTAIIQPQMRSMFGRGYLEPTVGSIIRDVERTFDRLYRDISHPFNALQAAIPHVTSAATQDANNQMYRLNIDMNGFRPEDIKLSLKDQVLRIEAKMDRKSDDGSRFYQQVTREYVLPESMKVEGLKSILTDDGVLRIEAPLPEPEKPREIPIENQTKCELKDK